MTVISSIRKTVDWRFWIALSLAMLVCYLIFSSFVALNQGKAKDERIDQLISGIRVQEQRAADERVAATRERLALLEYTKALAQRQRELLAYLRAHGIDIPVRFLAPIPSPDLSAIGKGSSTGRKSVAPVRPKITKAPLEDGHPGKSKPKGKAKGHGVH